MSPPEAKGQLSRVLRPKRWVAVGTASHRRIGNTLDQAVRPEAAARQLCGATTTSSVGRTTVAPRNACRRGDPDPYPTADGDRRDTRPFGVQLRRRPGISYAEARITSCVGMITDLSSSCPSIAATVRHASWRPISTVGCGHRRQRRVVPRRPLTFVTESDQRDIAGHRAAGVPERTQHTCGHHVGGGDDGVERSVRGRAAVASPRTRRARCSRYGRRGRDGRPGRPRSGPFYPRRRSVDDRIAGMPVTMAMRRRPVS